MILDEIVAHKREEVAASKQNIPLATLEDTIESLGPARDFRQALREPGIALIAEIKRASPSRGTILPADTDVVSLGELYEQAGARAMSILTDAKYFSGSIEDLRQVRRNSALPCLRKEFMIDPYQVYEARAGSADAILLIVRILDHQLMKDLHDLAKSLGMSTLVETHTEEEIERALKIGAHIIGINNRDLDTLTEDLDTTMRLKKRVPGGHILVSESGIRTRDDVKRLEDGGIDAILVGTSILTSNDYRAKIRELMGGGEG